ncbi:hypothetical protein E2C01_078177 [Portunus trituberculatus]|uniref:Uncharacterized protein n=1 Tax=Portunus trituberculatus TaxID=210409 RepID=A0A5B7IPD4_PORTR|nr:hypothetical protein [Portunus trituberculatus]
MNLDEPRVRRCSKGNVVIVTRHSCGACLCRHISVRVFGVSVIAGARKTFFRQCVGIRPSVTC